MSDTPDPTAAPNPLPTLPSSTGGPTPTAPATPVPAVAVTTPAVSYGQPPVQPPQQPPVMPRRKKKTAVRIGITTSILANVILIGVIVAVTMFSACTTAEEGEAPTNNAPPVGSAEERIERTQINAADALNDPSVLEEHGGLAPATLPDPEPDHGSDSTQAAREGLQAVRDRIAAGTDLSGDRFRVLVGYPNEIEALLNSVTARRLEGWGVLPSSLALAQDAEGRWVMGLLLVRTEVSEEEPSDSE